MDRIGKYTLQGELGKGAMGVVYKGLDPYIERPVAVKTIRFDLLSDPAEQEQAQVRFMREARSAGNLSHPNIVTIYEVGEDLGQTYIAMEYVDGQSLEKILSSGKTLEFEEVANLVARVGDALDYAHRKGVIHRDIKPGNILIDREGAPHIVDFGIARVAASTLTLTHTVLGTPFYMSPEQITGKKIDHRTDIFSLGTILYELLTGKKPFPGESLTTVIYKIINENPPPVRTYKKDLPEELDRIVNRAIAKDPEARYQRCADLARDLRRLTTARPLAERAFHTPEPELPYPGEMEIQGKSREKRRRGLLFVVAGMMAVVAAIVFSLYYYSGRGNLPRLLGGRGGPAPSVSLPPEPEEETPVSSKTPAPDIKLEETGKADIQEQPEAGPPDQTKSQPGLETTETSKPAETPRSVPAPAEKQPLRKEKEKPLPVRPSEPTVKEEGKKAAAEIQPPPAPQEKDTIELEKIYDDGLAALKAGRYEACIGSMERILEFQPDHRNAQYYLAIAKKRKEEEKRNIAEAQKSAQVARHLKLAEEKLSTEDYEGTLAEGREALRLDPENGTSKEYVQLATLKLARLEIKPIVDEYIRAITNRSLLAFYESYCTADLYQIISKDVAIILRLYESFQALASQIEMDISPAGEGGLKAEARFTQIMIGVSTARRIREVLFEGTIIWKMEKRDGKWKILNITYQTADKKTPGKESP